MTRERALEEAIKLLGEDAFVNIHSWRWKASVYTVGIWESGTGGERDGTVKGEGKNFEEALKCAGQAKPEVQ